MATTRMRVSNSAQVFHRIAAESDMATHDVGTSDANVSGLGGNGDFELETDANVTYRTSTDTVGITPGGEAIAEDALSGACTKFLFIKHTGFTSSTKETATAHALKIGVGDPDTVGWQLAAGESMTLHNLGTGTDAISNWKAESTSGNIFIEVVYL